MGKSEPAQFITPSKEQCFIAKECLTNLGLAELGFPGEVPERKVCGGGGDGLVGE